MFCFRITSSPMSMVAEAPSKISILFLLVCSLHYGVVPYMDKSSIIKEQSSVVESEETPVKSDMTISIGKSILIKDLSDTIVGFRTTVLQVVHHSEKS